MSDSIFRRAAYTILDLVTFKRGVKRIINNIQVRFPAKWSRYYEKDYEADNYLFLQEQVKKGMHIIDIGAHLGLFSVASSQLTGPGGKVICFEPTPGTFAVLKDTLRLNHCDNVTAVQAAVSEKQGVATFYISSIAGANTNSLVKNKGGNEVSGYDVRLVSIDSIVEEHGLHPSLIKIDAEGAELDVLKGGIKTFKEHKPVLILGLHPAFIKQKGDSLSEIYSLIKSNGYKIIYESDDMSESSFISQAEVFDVHLLPG